MRVVNNKPTVPATDGSDDAMHPVPEPAVWPSYDDSEPASGHVVEPLMRDPETPRRMIWAGLDPSRIRSRTPKGVWRDQFDFFHTRRSVVGFIAFLAALATSLAVLNIYWFIGWCLAAVISLIVFVRDTALTTSWMRAASHDRDVDVV
ncbi:MAG: hypothetical protein KDB60_05615 [Propionibacteriaceae bacterium]|nr:hypothetical protein [Propionibacteriaceae bacterium]